MFADIHCGDALKFLARIPDGFASLILTDPPYGTTDEPCDVALGESYRDALADEFLRVSPTGLFMFLPAQDIGDWFERLQSRGARHIRSGVWVKPGAGWNAYPYPSNALEFWLYCDRVDAPEYPDVILPVYQCANTQRMPEWEIGRKHPFQKPVSLLRTIIHNHSHDGDRIVDPFCGTGSVGISAMLEGRKYLINDLDAGFVERARYRIERYQDFSGHRKMEDSMSAKPKPKSPPRFNAAQKSAIMDLVVVYNLASDADKAKKFTEAWFLDTLRGNPKQTDKNAKDYKGILPRNRSAESIWKQVAKVVGMLNQHGIADANGNKIKWVSPKRSDSQILKSNMDALIAKHGLRLVSDTTKGSKKN